MMKRILDLLPESCEFRFTMKIWPPGDKITKSELYFDNSRDVDF